MLRRKGGVMERGLLSMFNKRGVIVTHLQQGSNLGERPDRTVRGATDSNPVMLPRSLVRCQCPIFKTIANKKCDCIPVPTDHSCILVFLKYVEKVPLISWEKLVNTTPSTVQ